MGHELEAVEDRAVVGHVRPPLVVLGEVVVPLVLRRFRVVLGEGEAVPDPRLRQREEGVRVVRAQAMHSFELDEPRLGGAARDFVVSDGVEDTGGFARRGDLHVGRHGCETAHAGYREKDDERESEGELGHGFSRALIRARPHECQQAADSAARAREEGAGRPHPDARIGVGEERRGARRAMKGRQGRGGRETCRRLGGGEIGFDPRLDAQVPRRRERELRARRGGASIVQVQSPPRRVAGRTAFCRDGLERFDRRVTIGLALHEARENGDANRHLLVLGGVVKRVEEDAGRARSDGDRVEAIAARPFRDDAREERGR